MPDPHPIPNQAGAGGGVRLIPVDPRFRLAETCAPVHWARRRWPNVDWHDGAFTWVGWEAGQVRWRQVREGEAPGTLAVTGTADPDGDLAWAVATLAHGSPPPSFADPVLADIADRFAGVRAYSAGNLWEGLVAAIVGQSITVAAAATIEGRVAALSHPGLVLAGRRMWPLPRPAQLAAADPAALRATGLTTRRAHALVTAGTGVADGVLPPDAVARADPDGARRALRALPLVGPWTAESALLWGLGLPDAHPTGDVALLRAARLAYADPDLTLKGLDRLADGWRPGRAWAARLLWTNLLGAG